MLYAYGMLVDIRFFLLNSKFFHFSRLSPAFTVLKSIKVFQNVETKITSVYVLYTFVLVHVESGIFG